jgi:hypothetical protein
MKRSAYVRASLRLAPRGCHRSWCVDSFKFIKCNFKMDSISKISCIGVYLCSSGVGSA